MADQDSAPSPREVAGQALRRSTKGDTIVAWDKLSETRRELWRKGADPVVAAALRAMREAAVDTVARELFHLRHQWAGTLTEWTMREWDHGGNQHVNKEPWRQEARRILGLVEATYRHNGHVVP